MQQQVDYTKNIINNTPENCKFPVISTILAQTNSPKFVQSLSLQDQLARSCEKSLPNFSEETVSIKDFSASEHRKMPIAKTLAAMTCHSLNESLSVYAR